MLAWLLKEQRGLRMTAWGLYAFVTFIFFGHSINNVYICSGRELFLSDASVFVDDAEAYDKYNREEESDYNRNKVVSTIVFFIHKQLKVVLLVALVC